MKKVIVSLIIVLGFAIGAVNANDPVKAKKDGTQKSNEYEVIIHLVWQGTNTPVPPQSYGGQLYAVNTVTNEFISEERPHAGEHIIYVEDGTYRFDGTDFYFVGICSKVVTIDDDTEITLEVWSE